MSRECDICGKSTGKGSTIVRHGLAKKKGGIGMHTTAINKRDFRPNIQSIRVSINGGVKRMKVCTACIKHGRIQKA